MGHGHVNSFSQSEAFANRVRELAEADGALFPPDPMARVAKIVNSSIWLPEEVAKPVIEDICSAPSGLPKTSVSEVRDVLHVAGFELCETVPPLLSDALQAELVTRWEADKADWNAAIASGFELLLTRTQRDA
jgi:hypothetical protein